MVSLTYTSAHQDRIALLLHECLYTNLSAAQKALIDNTSTTPGGIALDCLTILKQYAQWIDAAGGTTAPDVWEQWLVAMVVARAGQSLRPDRVAMYRRDEAYARAAAIEAFSRKAVTYDPGSDTEVFTATYQTFRYHVLSNTTKRKPPIWFSPETIDAATNYVVNNVWNGQDWNFRRRQVTMSIKTVTVTGATYTNGTKTLSLTGGFTNYTHVTGAMALISAGTGVTTGLYEIASKTSNDAIVLTSALGAAADGQTDFTLRTLTISFPDLPSGETFDSTGCRRFTYDSPLTTIGAQTISWADDDEMSMFRANYTIQYSRPVKVRFQQVGTKINWFLGPFPDQDYTARGAVYVQGPGTPSSASDTTVFAKFPAEFGPVLKDLVLAKCLVDQNAPDGREKWNRATEDLHNLLPKYAATGEMAGSVSVLDVYNDRTNMIGNSNPYYGIYPGAQGM